MRTVLLVVTGIFAAFFAASGLAEGYDCLRLLPGFAPSMWWFVVRQLATSVGFIGVAWIVWKQPRRLGQRGLGRVSVGVDSRVITGALAVLFGFVGYLSTAGFLVQRFGDGRCPL
jgi:hypothetical protein